MTSAQLIRSGAVAVLAALGVAAASEAHAVAENWQVGRIAGRAWVDRADGERSDLALGAEVQPGVTIYTADRSSLTLLRGPESMVIGPKSIIAVSEHPTEGLTTTVLERAGTVEFDVDHRNVRHFSVETPMLAAVVKGTRFRVSVSRQNGGVSVSRGTVEVTSLRSGQTTAVTVGQHAHVGNAGTLSVGGAGRAAAVTQSVPRAPVVNPIGVAAAAALVKNDFTAAELAAVATVATPAVAAPVEAAVTVPAVAPPASITTAPAAGVVTTVASPAAVGDPARTTANVSGLQALASAIATALTPGQTRPGIPAPSIAPGPTPVQAPKPVDGRSRDRHPDGGLPPAPGGRVGQNGVGRPGQGPTPAGPRDRNAGWGPTGSGLPGQSTSGVPGRLGIGGSNASGSNTGAAAVGAGSGTAGSTGSPTSGGAGSGSTASGSNQSGGSRYGWGGVTSGSSGSRWSGGGNGWSSGFRGR